MQNRNVVFNWSLAAFSVMVVIINALLSYSFGRMYLFSAFGIDGWLGPIIGGLYAVLVSDVAGLVWFFAYKRTAETRNQRSMSLLFGCLSLGLSIAMSINQLAVHSYGLVDLSAYHDSVGLVALTVVIIVTAVHIAGSAAFNLADAGESVKSKSADIRAKLIGESLNGLESSMDSMRRDLIKQMEGRMRRDVLAEMGFDPGDPSSFRIPASSNGRSAESESAL